MLTHLNQLFNLKKAITKIGKVFKIHKKSRKQNILVRFNETGGVVIYEKKNIN